jgi:hypothetical protein
MTGLADVVTQCATSPRSDSSGLPDGNGTSPVSGHRRSQAEPTTAVAVRPQTDPLPTPVRADRLRLRGGHWLEPASPAFTDVLAYLHRAAGHLYALPRRAQIVALAD